MKTKQTEAKLAAVHDYQSGAEIGREAIDWAAYQLWKSGDSEVCEAHRCLTPDQIERFSIRPDTTIFAWEVE